MIKWMKPSDYDLVTKEELKQSGFTEIMKMLELYSEQDILSACSEDEDLELFELSNILQKIESEGEQISQSFSKDTNKYRFKGIMFCITYQEGGFSSISFSGKEVARVNKQLLEQ